MEVKIYNLTGHTVNIWNREETGIILSILPEMFVPRCRQVTNTEAMVEFRGVEIPFTRTIYGKVLDLPDEEPGVYYIVSKIIAERCPERADLKIVNGLVRGINGEVIGCKSLGSI